MLHFSSSLKLVPAAAKMHYGTNELLKKIIIICVTFLATIQVILIVSSRVILSITQRPPHKNCDDNMQISFTIILVKNACLIFCFHSFFCSCFSFFFLFFSFFLSFLLFLFLSFFFFFKCGTFYSSSPSFSLLFRLRGCN